MKSQDFVLLKKNFKKKKKKLIKILPKKTKIFIYQNNKTFLKNLKKLNCDIAFSLNFSHIFKNDLIKIFKKGIVNLHLSYLPYCRGSAPNVFSIINNEPAGCTLHYINNNIDGGAIIDQKKIKIQDIDTGKSLYEKIYLSAIRLFKKNFFKILKNKIRTKKNMIKKGSIHFHKELETIDDLNIKKRYTASKFINILRSRTFEPHESAYIREKKTGRKIFIRVSMSYK